MRAFLAQRRDSGAGTVIEPRFCYLWNAYAYRDDSLPVGWARRFADDRRRLRSRPASRAARAAHPGAPAPGLRRRAADAAPAVADSESQSAGSRRGRGCESDGASAAINDSLPTFWRRARAARVPTTGRGLTFPPDSADPAPSWHERDLFAWFDAHGIEHFEPLEMWHIDRLRDEFRRRVGRSPKPDRSYRPSWPLQAWRYGRRVVAGIRARLPI